MCEQEIHNEPGALREQGIHNEPGARQQVKAAHLVSCTQHPLHPTCTFDTVMLEISDDQDHCEQ